MRRAAALALAALAAAGHASAQVASGRTALGLQLLDTSARHREMLPPVQEAHDMARAIIDLFQSKAVVDVDRRREHEEADSPVHTLHSALKPNGHDAQEVASHPASGRKGMQAPAFVYPTTFGVIMCAVLLVYGHRGWRVVFSIMSYLIALSTMKLVVKWVFVECAFKFPKFLTVLHFVSCGLVCLVALRARPGGVIPQPSLVEFVFMVSPIAFAASISIGLNNMALGFASVAFLEIIGSTTCLFTVGTVLLAGLPFDRWLLVPTVAVAMGCAISTVGEVNFSFMAMLLCFVSNTFRSAKVTLQQKLMTGKSRDKFDPITLLLWVSLPSAIVMLITSLLSEGVEPYRQVLAMDGDALGSLGLAVGVSCANAVALNLAQLFVTKDIGAVGGQLVAQAHGMLTVFGGMALFGESVTGLELAGFAEVLIGVYAFAAMAHVAHRERELERTKKMQAAKLSGCATDNMDKVA